MKIMFMTFCSLFFIQDLIAQDVNCVSANCDLYRSEKAKFEEKLKAIKCFGSQAQQKDCDQIVLARISKEFSAKVNSIFTPVNIKAVIKNDVQYNSQANAFEVRKQNATGIYDLIPVLDSPNIGVHWGGVENHQAMVDRLYNIDPSAADVKNSSWYLTQWKKDAAIMMSPSRRDPVITNSGWIDAYLGKPIFEINSPQGKYGTETSLLIFKDPQTNQNVFEIVGRNGWLNNVGGSNVFLSSNIVDTTNDHFDSSIDLTFNGKISRMKAKYYDNDSETRNATVVGQVFAAFTAHYSPPSGPKTSMFIQILFGDTRGQNFVYSNCYMNGSALEIVYSNNMDNDFASTAAPADGPLTPKKYNLNRYLCDALKQKYTCPDSTPNFAGMRGNLNNWEITSFYTGLETQAAAASKESQSVAGVIKGEVEMGMQYSALRVSANTNQKYLNCDEVMRGPVEPAPPGAQCTKGSLKGSDGKDLEFFCNCGDIPGGSKQPNGCFHRVASSAPTPIAEKPITTKPTTCTTGSFKNEDGQQINYSCGCGDVPGGKLAADGCYHKVADSTPANNCSKGTFNSAGKTIEWSCGCGEVSGAVKQADGCYHREVSTQASAAPTPAAPTANTGSFCGGSTKVNFICNSGPQNAGDGWRDAGSGCYHRATNEPCN